MGHQAQAGGGSDEGQNHGDQGSQHAEILRHLPRPAAVPSRVAPVTATRQLNGLRHTAADGADHRTLNHLTHTRHQGWVLSVLAFIRGGYCHTADHSTLNHHTHSLTATEMDLDIGDHNYLQQQFHNECKILKVLFLFCNDNFQRQHL